MKKSFPYSFIFAAAISFNLLSFECYAEVTFYAPFDGSVAPLIGETGLRPQRPARDIILWKIPIAYEDGIVGKALDARRSGIVYPTGKNFNLTEGAISFWVELQWDGSNTTDYCAFFELENWGLLYKYRDQTTLNFALKDKDNAFYYGCGADISDWKADQWHHVAITWDCRPDARKRRLYIDGALKGEGKITTTLLDSKNPKSSPFFTIGSRGGVCPARSLIDEFYIFDEALSNEEIERAYRRSWKPLKGKARKVAPIATDWLKPSAKRPPFPKRVKLDSEESIELGKQWEIARAWRVWTETREKISLNGYWRIRPAGPSTQHKGRPGNEPPWLYLKVPGSWGDEEFDIIDPKGNPIQGDIIGPWGNASRYRIYEMWYERDFTSNLSWRGRRIALEFNGVNSRGVVFLNGEEIGTVYEWEKTILDVTGKVRLGGLNRLAVLVTVPINVGSRRFRGVVGDVYLCASPFSVEISDLRVRTSVASGTLTIIGRCANHSPKDRQVSISGEVSLKNRKVLGLPEFKATLKAKGGVEFRIQAPWKDPQLWSPEHPTLYKLSLMAHSESKSGRRRLLDQPYEVKFGFREFSIRSDASRSRMEFYLNGRKTHLRAESSPPFNYNVYPGADESFIRNWFQTLKAAGFNSVRLYCKWAPARYVHYMDKIFDIADEMGMMLWPHAPDIIALQEVFDDPKVKELYKARVKNYLDRYANHPSIVMWHLNFNLGAYVGDIHPAALDGSYTPQYEIMKRRRRLMAESEKIYKELDPTRPVFHHAAGNFGDVYSVMTYLGFDIPLQEREDWPLHWSATGEMKSDSLRQEGAERGTRKPLIPIETGFPCILSWYENKTGSLNQVYSSAPLLVEYAAMYLGDEAYSMETAENVENYGESSPYLKREHLTKHSPHYLKLKSLFAKNTLRSWRAYGVSGIGLHAELWDAFWPLKTSDVWKPSWKAKGSYLSLPGPKPDYNPVRSAIQDPARPTLLGKTLIENFSPLLVYLGGSPGHTTSKDHSFFSHERVKKQIVAINDSLSPVDFKIIWRVTLGRNELTKEGRRLTVAPGEIKTSPISFITPNVEKRTEGKIWLTAVTKSGADEKTFKDELAFETFPREDEQSRKLDKLRIDLYDKVGKTAKMLTQAGVKFVEASKEDDLSRGDGQQPPYNVLIIGRESLDSAARNLLARARKQSWIENGLTVICFEQKGNEASDTPNIFGLPIRETSDRYVFIRDRAHPVLAGLSDSDFINWRKESDLIPPYSDFEAELRRYGAESLARSGLEYPEEFWKWGNRGVVATYVIEKPHIGAFRVLLDCGFDLMYTPLMEWIEGRGRIILCQLDVSNRYGIDPVATRLVDNLLSYCASSERAARETLEDGGGQTEAAYFGDQDTAKLLAKLQVSFVVTSLHGDLKNRKVLIVGNAAQESLIAKKQAITDFVSRGGHVFCVGPKVISSPTPQEDRSSWLPLKLSATERDVFLGKLTDSNAPLLRGLGKADLFWRRCHRVSAMRIADLGKSGRNKGDVVVSVPYGKGYYVFCSINPQLFDDNWQKSKAARIIAAILTNMGVKSSAALDFSRDKVDYSEFPFLGKPIDFNPYKYRRW